MDNDVNVFTINRVRILFIPDIGYCYIDGSNWIPLESSEELINLCGDSLINNDLINKIDAYCVMKKLL